MQTKGINGQGAFSFWISLETTKQKKRLFDLETKNATIFFPRLAMGVLEVTMRTQINDLKRNAMTTEKGRAESSTGQPEFWSENRQRQRQQQRQQQQQQ